MQRPPEARDVPKDEAPRGVRAEGARLATNDATPPAGSPGFLFGARAFLGGIATLVSTEGLLPLSLVPIFMTFLVSVALSAAAVKLVPLLIAAIVGTSSAWWSVALQVLVTIAAVLLALVIALAVAQPLSGPALEAMVRRVEKKLGAAPRPEAPFFVGVTRSLASALLGLGFGLPLLALAFLLHFVPGGSLVAVPLKFFVAMLAIAWDLCDYPLSVRGVPLRERVRFVTKHFGAVLGFSLGAALVALLPCGGLLLLPAGVCGATRLVIDLERHDARRAR